MRSIQADARHEQLLVIADENADARRFAGWAMGYSGHSRYVERFLAPLHTDAGGRRHQLKRADELVDLMGELCKPSNFADRVA
jgi:hypothetical protein